MVVELCESFHRLGCLYLSHGDLVKAVPLLEEAVEVSSEKKIKDWLSSSSSPPPSSVVVPHILMDVVLYINSLSNAYERQGRLEESRSLSEQASDMWAWCNPNPMEQETDGDDR